MHARQLSLILIFLVGLSAASITPARAAASLELYGTFESMGVIVTLAAGDDPDGDGLSVLGPIGLPWCHAGN